MSSEYELAKALCCSVDVGGLDPMSTALARGLVRKKQLHNSAVAKTQVALRGGELERECRVLSKPDIQAPFS